MNRILKNTVILTIITLVSGVALGGVYQITKEPIAKAQEEAKQEAYQQVFEDVGCFEELKWMPRKLRMRWRQQVWTTALSLMRQ